MESQALERVHQKYVADARDAAASGQPLSAIARQNLECSTFLRDPSKVAEALSAASTGTKPEDKKEKTPHACDVCNRLFATFACGSCKVHYYCGPACQTIAWKKPFNHKLKCPSYLDLCEARALENSRIMNDSSSPYESRCGTTQFYNDEHCFLLATGKFSLFPTLLQLWADEAAVIIPFSQRGDLIGLLRCQLTGIFRYPRNSSLSPKPAFTHADPTRTLSFFSSSPQAWSTLLDCSLAHVAALFTRSAAPRGFREALLGDCRDVWVMLCFMMSYEDCFKAALSRPEEMSATVAKLKSAVDSFKDDDPWEDAVDPRFTIKNNVYQLSAIIQIMSKRVGLGDVDIVKLFKLKGSRRGTFVDMILPLAGQHIVLKGDAWFETHRRTV